MITAARVEEVCSVLAAAGPSWPTVAKALPELEKLSPGVPSGPGLCRPWVLLQGAHEQHECPVRLLQHESGIWFPKGEYARTVERRAREHQATLAPTGGGRPVPWWKRERA